MPDSFYIAWKYITFNRYRSIVLIVCVTLIAALPLALDVLVDESEHQFLSRARTTPLIAGAKGSALDLVMNTLYFDDEAPELISMKSSAEIMESGLALPLPMYIRFKARGFSVVGTTFDYFDFRKLSIVEGRGLAMLGECVLGAEVAESLGLKPGDSLFTSPETLFDLSGVYPLKMKVVGIFKKNHSADDAAVFVDIKTSWIIEGLGHGHEDVTQTKDLTVIQERMDKKTIANAKLMQYNEVTAENLDSFHFHGNSENFPITAVIALPFNEKSSAILRGRYLDHANQYMIVLPEVVIEGLLENIFRIKSVLDAVILIVALSTIMALILVFFLTLRLRQREINTIFKLGCNRSTILRLLAAEVILILTFSSIVCLGILELVRFYDEALVRQLFI